MNTPIIIRDPVHGYLRVATHERVLIDHPVTQRLRNVAQTGLAQMIYPEANTSRFVHSLGAMHLASRFLISSIENAEDATVERFFDELENLVQPNRSDVQLSDFDALFALEKGSPGGGLLSPRLAFRDGVDEVEMTRRRQLLVAAEGALRLAALFHDLGHLPFSHDLEFAFETYASEAEQGALSTELLSLVGGPPHEVIGHNLASLLMETLVAQEPPHIRAMYRLAKEILDNKPPYAEAREPKATVLDWLHSLVDGELDVDRGDYLLRDGRALGFEFAAYDLERLLDNIVLVWSVNDGYITAVHEAGLSALESFVLSRYRSSQMMIRHHKNAQLGAALRHASVEVFKKTEAAKELLQDLEKLVKWSGTKAKNKAVLAERAELLERYSRYDDAWWISLLRQKQPSDELERACQRLVLMRQPTLASSWKRRGELKPDELETLNSRVKQFITDAEGRVRWPERRKELRKHNVLTALHKFRPYRTRPGGGEDESLLLIWTGRGESTPAARMSPLIHSLQEAWRKEVHVHTFAVVANGKPAVSKEKILKVLLSPPGGGN